MANHVNNLHFFAVVFTNTVITIVAATAVEEKKCTRVLVSTVRTCVKCKSTKVPLMTNILLHYSFFQFISAEKITLHSTFW